MRPTYNHTRGDSPLYPCAECAARQTDAERIESLRCRLADVEELTSALTDERDRFRTALVAVCEATEFESSGLALVVRKLACDALGVE